MTYKIRKIIFFSFTDKYYSTMQLHDLLQIYFKILDFIYPNHIPEYNDLNVFTRLYSSRKPPYRSCCTSHSKLFNLQMYIKKYIKTDHEKKQYQHACKFFRHLQIEIINSIEYSNIWYQNKYVNSQEKKRFIKFIKKKLNNWEGIKNFIKFNRKGKIIKFFYI